MYQQKMANSTKPTTRIITFRIDSESAERLIAIARSEGYNTISNFIRKRCLDDNFSQHKKLNQLLEKLDELKGVVGDHD